MTHRFERMETEVSKFFPACPLCQEKTIQTRFNDDWFARDYIFCSNCHAKWHIYYLQELKWIKLIKPGLNDQGQEYVGIEHEPAFWLDLIEEKPVKATEKKQADETTMKAEPKVKEKEIIREKEVIVKIKCQYCGKRYNEALDACPYCGGKQ